MEIMQFLLKANLCLEENGRYKISARSTFVSKGSPHVLKHHSNWRIKAIQKGETLSAQEMMFTSQISISKKDFTLVREKVAQFLKELEATVGETIAEDVANLNIDWFWIDK
jgi:hypothetical protein